jgi:hypothetical protein
MRKRIALCCLIALIATLGISFAQNNSAGFDGNGRIRVLDNSAPNGGLANQSAYKISGNTITVEASVYPLYFFSPQLGNTIVSRPLNATNADPFVSYRLFVEHGNGLPQAAFAISDGSPGSYTVVVSPDPLPILQWTHIAGTYDGNSLKIYVNGMLKAQVSTKISLTSTGIGFYVGRFLSDGFIGTIDEVRLWNISRSATDIQSTMNTILTGTESGLAGYWRLDETSIAPNGTLITPDATSNHNDLSVQGALRFVPFNYILGNVTTSVSVNPTSIDFGTDEQGVVLTSPPLTISNLGSNALIGFVKSLSNDVPSIRQPVYFLSPGESVSVFASVRPLVPGPYSTLLSTVSNSSTEAQVSITGTAIAVRQLDTNNISMWVLRDGRFARNLMAGTLSGGLEWPKGSGKTAVFASGIWIGATVGGSIRTAVASYGTEFQAGPIINGTPADPRNNRYRVYKISAGDNAGTNADYDEWPADLGAPVNSDGTPKILADQTLFCVYNDMNPSKHFPIGPDGPFGTAPLGAEVQQTTFGFGRPGVLGNTVFLRFKVINKSTTTWQNTYIALWSDPDLGFYGDDFVGIDTARSLGFVYNGANTDGVYGTSPPAAGYRILKGAFYRRPVQAFAFYSVGATFPLQDPSNAVEAYNFMSGLRADGSQYMDPMNSNYPTKFPLYGDPVIPTGWVDSNPGDRRFLVSTGPFDLGPGQAKEFIAAIVLAQGLDNLNSITALREASDEVQSLFDGGQVFGGALESVASVSVTQGDTATLSDLGSSGAELTLAAGSGGASVEMASYIEAPPGAESISNSAIGSVGNYLDVQVSGTIEWPVYIRKYYTRSDLEHAGVFEGDLLGLYYWRASANQWILYSDSQADDLGRGESTTGVDTANVVINGVTYEGFVYATAYHLTPIVIGAKKKTVADRYQELLQYVESLPNDVFKKPIEERRRQLLEKINHSKSVFLSGNMKGAAQELRQDVLNHVTIDGQSMSSVWILNAEARATITRIINEILVSMSAPTSNTPASSMSASSPSELLPTEFGLSQNYPNPFNPSTVIEFSLPERSFVKLTIMNLLGQEIETLIAEEREAGSYRVKWNAGNFPTGTYFYRLQAGGFAQIKKLILLK